MSTTRKASTTGQNPPYNKESISQKYLCPVCNEIFNEPYQASCGCRYCFDCLLITEQSSTGKCVICNEKLNPEDKSPDKAYKKEVLNMIIKCITCTWEGKLMDYREHFGSHKITCQHCGKPFDTIEQLNQHVNVDCELLTITCPYAIAGCEYNGLLNKKNLNQHLQEYLVNHMKYSFEYFNERITSVELAAGNLSTSSITSESIASTIKTKVRSSDQQSSVASKKPKGDTDASLLQSSSISSSRLNAFEASQKSLVNDFNNQTFLFQRLAGDVGELKEIEENQRKEIEQLQKSLTVSQVTIIGLEERLLAQEKASFNGTFVWKILGVQQKIQDSKSGKQTSFYSPAFYSHHNGYKMCSRIYLNGDGMGRGTHVSLFFVLMKGEHDALLRWPFRQKVTFVLIDQSQNESKENIVDSFKPDPNSTSFRRPVSEMNIASGIPLFCNIQKIYSTEHEYIKDDIMFVKIIVDTRDLTDI